MDGLASGWPLLCSLPWHAEPVLPDQVGFQGRRAVSDFRENLIFKHWLLDIKDNGCLATSVLTLALNVRVMR